MTTLAVIGGAVALILALVGLLVWRAASAARSDEKAKSATAALEHQVNTAKEVEKADEEMAKPGSGRAARVRGMFERDDK